MEQVATFIQATAAAEVPFKATAGLHHPLRHFSDAVGTDEHGFLNVFIAATLAFHDTLTVPEISEVLERRDASELRVDDDTFAWNTQELSHDEIEDARLVYAISFGSCCFDEPRDDLTEMGLRKARRHEGT